MRNDVEYYTLLHNQPRLVKSAVPHINIAENKLPVGPTSVSSLVAHSSTSAFVSNAVVSCSTTSTVTSAATFTSNLTEPTTVDSSSMILTSFTSPQKRKFISSSSNEQKSTKPSNEQTSGSLYEPGSESESNEDEIESDSEETDSDLDEFGEAVLNESSYTEDERKLICEMTIKAMRHKIQHYTGIPESSAYVIELIEKIANISRRNWFIVLRKIRHNETFVILGDLLGVSAQRAGQIFSNDAIKLAQYLKAFIYWPDPKEIKWNLPLQFKHAYKGVDVIIDCFETPIAKPSHPVDQALSWSSYKHSNTIKHLIVSTPDGFIIFISKGFTGRITDNEIVKRSGFLDFIQENCEILADRGFKDIEVEVVSRGGKLLKPPSTEAGKIYTSEEAKLCKSIAAVRIHVERVIGLEKLQSPKIS